MQVPQTRSTTPSLAATARAQLSAHQAQAAAAARFLDQADASPAGSAAAQKALGLALYEMQDYAGAQEHLAKAKSLEPGADTSARLAMAAWRGGNLDLAEKSAREAVAAEPKGHMQALTVGTRPSYETILAQILLSQGKLDAARASANTALTLDPHDVAAVTVLAIIQVTAGEAREGAETLAKAEAMAPAALASQLSAAGASLRLVAAANLARRPTAADLAGLLRRIS